jgi:hypothetical protein
MAGRFIGSGKRTPPESGGRLWVQISFADICVNRYDLTAVDLLRSGRYDEISRTS